MNVLKVAGICFVYSVYGIDYNYVLAIRYILYNADYNYFYYNAVLVMYFDLLVLYMLHIIAIL